MSSIKTPQFWHGVCMFGSLLRLVGKLGFSAVIDAAGWTGHTVKMDLLRVLSMILVPWRLIRSPQHQGMHRERDRERERAKNPRGGNL